MRENQEIPPAQTHMKTRQEQERNHHSYSMFYIVLHTMQSQLQTETPGQINTDLL